MKKLLTTMAIGILLVAGILYARFGLGLGKPSGQADGPSTAHRVSKQGARGKAPAPEPKKRVLTFAESREELEKAYAKDERPVAQAAVLFELGKLNYLNKNVVEANQNFDNCVRKLLKLPEKVEKVANGPEPKVQPKVEKLNWQVVERAAQAFRDKKEYEVAQKANHFIALHGDMQLFSKAAVAIIILSRDHGLDMPQAAYGNTRQARLMGRYYGEFKSQPNQAIKEYETLFDHGKAEDKTFAVSKLIPLYRKNSYKNARMHVIMRFAIEHEKDLRKQVILCRFWAGQATRLGQQEFACEAHKCLIYSRQPLGVRLETARAYIADRDAKSLASEVKQMQASPKKSDADHLLLMEYYATEKAYKKAVVHGEALLKAFNDKHLKQRMVDFYQRARMPAKASALFAETTPKKKRPADLAMQASLQQVAGENDKALATWKLVLEKERTCGNAKALANLQAKLGMHKEAADNYMLAYKLNTNPRLKYYLGYTAGEAMVRAGQKDRALDLLHRLATHKIRKTSYQVMINRLIKRLEDERIALQKAKERAAREAAAKKHPKGE